MVSLVALLSYLKCSMGEAFLLSLRFFFIHSLLIVAPFRNEKKYPKVVLEQCGRMEDSEVTSSNLGT